MGRYKKNEVIVLKQHFVKSAVWLSLSGTAKGVYLIFRTKCVIDKVNYKSKRNEVVIVNNGEIVFTYAEAVEKYGISRSRFKRAIDELIAKGFIDIAATGMGVHKVTTYYAISERWHNYGTDNFVEKTRPKPSIANPGFKKGNQLWKRRKKNSSVKNNHGVVRKSEHGCILAMRTNNHGQKVTILYKQSEGKWLEEKIA